MATTPVSLVNAAQLGRAAGVPDYSSMGASAVTPVIYAQKTLIKFYKKTFLTEICNTDYEGEIKGQGDKVIIRTVPDITIKDYVVGQDLDFEMPEGNTVILEINKAKYYGFKIDKVWEIQNDINQFEKWTADAAEQMKISVETAFLTDVFKTNALTNVSAYNRGVITNGYSGGSGQYILGTDLSANPVTVTNASPAGTLASLNPIDLIAGAESCLTEQNIPQDSQRWMIIPTWFQFMLTTGELRRADGGGAPGNRDVLENGKIGRLGAFNLYVSNNLPMGAIATTGTIIPFGHKLGLTFATQLTDSEVVPYHLGFGKVMKGLQVYGYKAIKPDALGIAVAKK